MKTIKKIAIGLTSFISITTFTMPHVLAEKPKTICETSGGFNDWDFWVGEWNVVTMKGGQQAGTNSISKEEAGCFLYENWLGAQGTTGRSINYYDPTTKKWRQIWIAASGYNIDIEGKMEDGSMVLVGTIHYYKQNRIIPFKGIWTPLKDGSVRQFFQQYKADDDTWATWGDLRYIKAPTD